MIKSLNSFGILPSELIVVSAISAAIDDLRANPFLLDYIFNWFAADPLTSKVLGDAEKQRAKDWFINNQIFVTYAGFRLSNPVYPVISVELTNSVENATTLGDVNYDTEENVDASQVGISPQSILGPFTVSSFDSATGLVTLPDDLTTENIFQNMILMDIHNNTGYQIRQVLSSKTFSIDPNITADFTKTYIAPIDSFYVTQLESTAYKNTFTIFMMAMSEPLYTIYLSTIVRFILQRYKKELIEGRGIDVSSINMGSLYIEPNSEPGEPIICQNITMSGIVRECWPALISPKIQGIKIQGINIIGAGVSPVSLEQEVIDQGWGTVP